MLCMQMTSLCFPKPWKMMQEQSTISYISIALGLANKSIGTSRESFSLSTLKATLAGPWRVFSIWSPLKKIQHTWVRHFFCPELLPGISLISSLSLKLSSRVGEQNASLGPEWGLLFARLPNQFQITACLPSTSLKKCATTSTLFLGDFGGILRNQRAIS